MVVVVSCGEVAGDGVGRWWLWWVVVGCGKVARGGGGGGVGDWGNVGDGHAS